MKRVRVLIYTCDDPVRMEKQRLNDTKSKLFGGMTIESFELDPMRITILELLRLFRREKV